MAKTGPTFKLSKATKTSLALGKFKDEHARGQWRRAMIDAEYTASIVPKITKKERGNGNYNTTSNSATPSAE
jgi:hypothetical protein